MVLFAIGLQQPIPKQDLQARLAQAVDLPTAGERRKAARALATDRTVSLEQWLASCRQFSPLSRVPAGSRTDTVNLRVAGKWQQTPIHLYVSKRYEADQPAPLILAHHGAGGSGAGMISLWRPVAEALGAVLVAPDEVGDNQGYRFQLQERQAAQAVERWARRQWNVDENRIFLTGVSRGGHLSWDLALRFPDRYAACMPMIGGPTFLIDGGRNNMRYLENLRDLPIRNLQGSLDQPALLFNLRHAFRKLQGFGASDAQLIEFPELGHQFDFQAVDWLEFLGRSRRQPWPKQVIRLAARKGEGRNSWVQIKTFTRDVQEEFKLKVEAEHWNSLDEDGRKLHYMEQVDQKTARLEVHWLEAGHFQASGRGVKSFSLLLSEAMIGEKGAVKVEFGGKVRRKKGRPSARVLLEEFVESFDRSFLPLARFDFP